MRKLAALAGAGVMLLALAGPALAIPFPPMWGSDNIAVVENSAEAVADTGGNSQDNTAKATLTMVSSATAGSGGDRSIRTGSADAYAGALVVANTHVGCGPCAPAHDDDVALVGNGAGAYAFSGGNSQDDYARVLLGVGSQANAGDSGGRTVVTGPANSRARAWAVVNTHWGY